MTGVISRDGSTKESWAPFVKKTAPKRPFRLPIISQSEEMAQGTSRDGPLRKRKKHDEMSTRFTQEGQEWRQRRMQTTKEEDRKRDERKWLRQKRERRCTPEMRRK